MLPISNQDCCLNGRPPRTYVLGYFQRSLRDWFMTTVALPVGVLFSLEFPAEEAGSYGEAGAYRGQHDQASFFQTVVVERRLHGQRNGGSGGVAVAIDVDHHLFQRQSQALGS